MKNILTNYLAVALLVCFGLACKLTRLMPDKTDYSAGDSTQKSRPYPANAEDIIASVEVFSKVDFSVKDAVERLGTINEKNRDDGFSGTDWAFLVTPFPSERERIKRVVVSTFDKKRKLGSVAIYYVKPILISYGKLKEKYGEPELLPLPHVTCLPGKNCQHPVFVGYDFSFVPDRENSASDKRVEVSIDLEMEWSKEVPKHSDKDFLAVKAIRFKRGWNGELGMKQNSN